MAAGLRPTRWDSIIFYRAGLVAAIALAMAWLVTAFTDEGGIGWQERAGRTIPLTPICAAIGAWGALAPVRARGEARALEALGRSLGQIAAAAVAGGAALALGAALAMQSAPGIDVAGFYPTALRPTTWRWEQGTFVNTIEGVRIDREGSPARLSTPFERPRAATIPRGGRAAAAVATAMAGVALPMLVAQLLLERPARGARSSRNGNFARATWQPTLASAAAIVASVMLFQAAAARLVSAWLAAVPPGLLLGFAVARHRRRN